MTISKQVYIDKSVSNHRFILWKLKKGKKVNNIYCIIYTEDIFLEIINSNKINEKYDKAILIGIANTREKAMELLVNIFDDVYVPNPNIDDMKRYFTTNKS